tara:strand:- start:210 stop:677 length:468 start_codon:yes stop_codon:yes gene_type:complete
MAETKKKSTFSSRRAERDAERKKRWERGESNLQKAALFIKNKVGYTKDSKGILSRAIAKSGTDTAKKQRTAKDMDWAKKTRKSGRSITAKAGFSDKERVALKQKTEDKAAERKRMNQLRRGTAEQKAEYKKIKKKQRKAANEKAFARRGVNPNDY